MVIDLICLPYYVISFNKKCTNATLAVHDYSFRRIIINLFMVPAIFLCCLGFLFFSVPPAYEFVTNSYLGEGKPEKNPYSVIGVSSTDSMETIKKAFKKLSMKYHPDKNPNNQEEAKERMAELNSAMDKIKKGAAQSWTGEAGYFSEEGLNSVANKWSVIIGDVQKGYETAQESWGKRLKEKQKLKKKHTRHARKIRLAETLHTTFRGESGSCGKI
jgi:hypothetical protein